MIFQKFITGLISVSVFVLTAGNGFGQDITKDELLGKIDPAKHPAFILIDKKYTDKAGIYLRKETYEAFCRMAEAASVEGFTLKIISATRNFSHQKNIWEKKWKAEKYRSWKDCDKVTDILKYSSVPGTSRHHWGTDVDINSLENEFFAAGQGLKLYKWMIANAASFGFYQTYTSKENGRTGFEEEKWHWSYFPLADNYLEKYRSMVKDSDLSDFPGCHCISELGIIDNYVAGVAASPAKK